MQTQHDPQFTQHEPLYTQRNPNANRWNIGRVGSPHFGAHVGHGHFMLFVSISFALGSQSERGFQWNRGFRKQNRENVFLFKQVN